ncbi:hypothetical protein, partial [uncultured Treponema sp.]|uniref:hypothetical protein n=1 Tax=uncultured Treponema sp. TaxID=162155 RepID=UPI0025DBB640
MKKFGKAFAVLASLSFILSGLLFSCDADSTGDEKETVAVKSVEISGENTVEVEGEIQLTAKVLPE